MWQGLTIGIHRAHTYNYFCWHTHNFGHGYVDKYAHFFPMIFWSFQIFLVLIILNYLKIYSYIFNSFVLKKPYFSIFHTNYFINASPYLKASTNLKVKKIHKIDENSSNQRSKNLYLLRDYVNFTEIFRKNKTYEDINSDKKESFKPSSESIFFEIYP